MNIRGKLLTLILIPLLGVLGASVWGFRSQSVVTEVAEDAVTAVQTTSKVHQAILAMGDERAALAPTADRALLPDLQAATDAAFAEVFTRDLSPEMTAMMTDMQALVTEARTRVASGDLAAYAEPFSTAIETLLNAGGGGESYFTAEQAQVANAAHQSFEMIEAREAAWLQYLLLDPASPSDVLNVSVALGEAEVLTEEAYEFVQTQVEPTMSEAQDSVAERRLNELAFLATTQLAAGEGSIPADQVVSTLSESRAEWRNALGSADQFLLDKVTWELDRANGIRSLFTLLGLGGLVVLGGLVFVIYRSITLPLGSLLNRAQTVADDELPELIRVLRHSDSVAELPSPSVIPVESDDEIGQLVSAFNDVQVAAYDLATEQALGRRNVGDMFINLGRRNQQLLQRILNQLTELEREEENPETLDTLFALDNIVTRMRRNAESLLVLAGGQTPRQWSNPVTLEDTVRSALSEVENYQRVDIAALAEVHLPGNMVADVAHMLAELIENAVNFSDPNSQVLVGGHFENENYVVTIFDQGIGMSEDELETNNRRISDPPPLDQAPTRFLGLFVVGRLADRHEILVRLAKAPGRGLMARVQIPAQHLLLDGHNAIDGGDTQSLTAAGDFLDDELAELSNSYADPINEDLSLGDVDIESEAGEFDLPNLDHDGSVFEESTTPPVEVQRFEVSNPTTPDKVLPDLPVRGGGLLKVPQPDEPVAPEAAPIDPVPVAEPEPARAVAPVNPPPAPAAPTPVAAATPESLFPSDTPTTPLPVRNAGQALDQSPAPVASAPATPAAQAPAPARAPAPGLPDNLPLRVRGAALDTSAPVTPESRAADKPAPAEDNGDKAGNFSSMMSAFSTGVRRGIEDNAFESLDEGLDQ